MGLMHLPGQAVGCEAVEVVACDGAVERDRVCAQLLLLVEVAARVRKRRRASEHDKLNGGPGGYARLLSRACATASVLAGGLGGFRQTVWRRAWLVAELRVQKRESIVRGGA